MKYIKVFEKNTIHPFFTEILECVKNTYENMMGEFYEWFNEYGNDLEEWRGLIYGCLNEDDKKDLGRLFIKKYIGGDGLEELVKYLCSQLNISPKFEDKTFF